MQCIQNVLALFATTVSYARKMFMKLTPGYPVTPVAVAEVEELLKERPPRLNLGLDALVNSILWPML
jgi:hypothetical protein